MAVIITGVGAGVLSLAKSLLGALGSWDQESKDRRWGRGPLRAQKGWFGADEPLGLELIGCWTSGTKCFRNARKAADCRHTLRQHHVQAVSQSPPSVPGAVGFRCASEKGIWRPGPCQLPTQGLPC